jgi:hypothetical protein
VCGRRKKGRKKECFQQEKNLAVVATARGEDNACVRCTFGFVCEWQRKKEKNRWLQHRTKESKKRNKWAGFCKDFGKHKNEK